MINPVIKRIHKSMELDEAKWPPKQCQWFINSKKEDGLRCRKDIKSDGTHFYSDIMLRVYLRL